MAAKQRNKKSKNQSNGSSASTKQKRDISSSESKEATPKKLQSQESCRTIKSLEGKTFCVCLLRVPAQISNVLEEATSPPPIVGVSLRYANYEMWQRESCSFLYNPFFIGGFVTMLIVLSVSSYQYLSHKTVGNLIVVAKVEDGQHPHSIHHIDRRSELSLDEYRNVYDAKWPVLITDVLTSMKAMNWTKSFFLQKYGDHRITMKGVQGRLEDGNSETLAMPMGLFLSHLHEGMPDVWTYLQDELFLLQRPELRDDIDDILYLQDDYFQIFPEEIRPWNLMLLWGTKYSRSYLHIDPYNWTGTNAVFSGLKKWKLYPPGQDDLLYIKKNSMSGFPLDCYKYNSEVDAFNPDLTRFPLFAKAKAMEFDQHPGELLLIPTGWFHQAFNDDETIAVSSQVMNINNYKIVLEEIFKADNLDTGMLPSNYDTLPPEAQVQAVMDHLPPHILEKGREVTTDALHQINQMKPK